MSAASNFSLTVLRTRLNLTQSEMAKRMGLSLRSYQELELYPTKVRSRHVRLAESVAFEVAVEINNPTLVPKNLGNQALRFARMILKRISE